MENPPLFFKGELTSEIIFILKEILFPFQRYKYFKLLAFWQVCDVTAALHQSHCVRFDYVFMCLLIFSPFIVFEYN